MCFIYLNKQAECASHLHQGCYYIYLYCHPLWESLGYMRKLSSDLKEGPGRMARSSGDSPSLDPLTIALFCEGQMDGLLRLNSLQDPHFSHCTHSGSHDTDLTVAAINSDR